MLTQQQYRLLQFIHQRIRDVGVSPSFDEMRLALELKSKSGIHKLIQALEERGFIRRLPNRARALEVCKLPAQEEAGLVTSSTIDGSAHEKLVTKPKPIDNSIDYEKNKEWHIPNWAHHLGNSLAPKRPTVRLSEHNDDEHEGALTRLPLYGKIAAGTPITALQDNGNFIDIPSYLIGSGEHYCLRVEGDSMIEAGILNNDVIVIKKCDMVDDGTIAVALIDEEEATLKRVYAADDMILLKPANRHYRERALSHDRVRIQGRLVGLMRRF